MSDPKVFEELSMDERGPTQSEWHAYQLKIAGEHGKPKEDSPQTWLQEYQYHLGSVENPLPFLRFAAQYRRLDRLLSQERAFVPGQNYESQDREVNNLCRQLGY